MLGTVLFLLATVSAILSGLAVRATMRGRVGHLVEDRGRLVGG